MREACDSAARTRRCGSSWRDRRKQLLWTSFSYEVGEARFHPLKKPEAEDEGQQRDRDGDQGEARELGAEDRPTERVDDARHRVQVVDEMPALRHDRRRIRHRREEEPELYQERERVPHVAV